MKPEAFIKVEDQTNQFDLDHMPSASVVETVWLQRLEGPSPSHSWDPCLSGCKCILKQGNFLIDWNTVSVPTDSWIRMQVGECCPPLIFLCSEGSGHHFAWGNNDLANFSLLSYHVLGTETSDERGMGRTAALAVTDVGSQLLSLHYPSSPSPFCQSEHAGSLGHKAVRDPFSGWTLSSGQIN